MTEPLLAVDNLSVSYGRPGSETLARFFGDTRCIGACISQGLLVVGECLVRFVFETSRSVEITLDPVTTLINHVADARQRDPAHDEEQRNER